MKKGKMAKPIIIAAILALFNISILAASFTVATAASSTYASPNVGQPQPGLQGSINGEPTCHCPDDANNCLCD